MNPDTTYSEPGALDNRLSLDPNDVRWQEKLAAWRDGQEYTVSVRLRQVSPGEFEVIGMTGGPESDAYSEEEEEAPLSEEAETAAPSVQDGMVNPAVQALLGARQRGNGS